MGLGLIKGYGLAMDDQIFVTAAALIDRDGLVFIQKRPQGGSMAGLWEFPGGKVEMGETPETALVRELAEEIGIRVNPSALTPLSFASAPLGQRHLLLLLYVCHEWTGTPQALQAEEVQWIAPAMMRGLPMPPADVPLVEALIHYQASGAHPVK